MRKNLLLVAVIIFIGVLGYTILIFSDAKPKKESLSKDSNSSLFFSELTGLSVASSTPSVPPVVAVMIDNHPDARPQFGLSQAEIVYEAPVEGDFTRFMAIFERDSEVVKVGPVRSARSYYLDWQAEYGVPLYLHCGGSPEALSRIKKEDIFAANEFYWGKYYWRDNNFTAPHNLFTDSNKWGDLWRDYDTIGQRVWSGWEFDLSISPTTSNASSFVVNYGAGYKVEWRFDKSIEKYSRFLEEKKQDDADGNEILLDNVIVQYVSTKVVDDLGRKEIQTVGSGSVRVFRDGRVIPGIWKKNMLNERTRFFADTGEEIKLKPGKTWLQIVPDSGTVSITG